MFLTKARSTLMTPGPYVSVGGVLSVPSESAGGRVKSALLNGNCKRASAVAGEHEPAVGVGRKGSNLLGEITCQLDQTEIVRRDETSVTPKAMLACGFRVRRRCRFRSRTARRRKRGFP